MSMTFVHAEDPPAFAAAGVDDDGYERACAANWAGVVRYLRAIAQPGLDIEDLAGRVIEIAWRRRGDVFGVDAFTPWLLGIATNVARNAHRSSRRFERLRARIGSALDRDASTPSPHAELMGVEPGAATQALAALSNADRQILALHAWEELSNDEIATVLQITVAAVGQRLHRARKRLALALDAMDREEHTP